MNIYPKCPIHGRSAFIQMDAQSHIMACEAKPVGDHFGKYLVPDRSSCDWVSDEYRIDGNLVWVIPFPTV